ncbi:hypothetical protein C9374_012717 [Naegleria lovaniensis]|uniref:Thioredoxin domain-containing protein n=1 Tax=Naegleria lovaniensis TaxID=51637 RepID=A0AA88GWX3_NAELO|nr:uncharacterized protein C9374_012717 [Naegleria lovaniensis]KAG2392465.1 hypothetical protein C9374_012717 [Naegleria lovaniensis]
MIPSNYCKRFLPSTFRKVSNSAKAFPMMVFASSSSSLRTQQLSNYSSGLFESSVRNFYRTTHFKQQQDENEKVEAQHVADRSDCILNGTHENFQSIIESGEPIIVDFYADWCGPCKKLGPALERNTLKHGGVFKLIKVNIDEQPQIAEAFQVQEVPTVVFIMDRKLVDRFKGAIPDESVAQALDNFAQYVTRTKSGGSVEQQQAPTVDADSPEYLLGIAAQLLKNGDLDEASKVYSQVVEKSMDQELPDFAAKGLSGLLTISLFQYKMDAAKSIISRLQKDHIELTKSDKEISEAISLYELYKEAGDEVVNAIHEGKPVESLGTEKEKVLYLYLLGHAKEAIEHGISLLKKSATKADGRAALIRILDCLEKKDDKKKLVMDTRKRMASLLF